MLRPSGDQAGLLSMGGAVGEAQRGPAVDELDVDVRVAAAPAVPGVGNLAGVGRERGEGFNPRIARDGGDSRRLPASTPTKQRPVHLPHWSIPHGRHPSRGNEHDEQREPQPCKLDPPAMGEGMPMRSGRGSPLRGSPAAAHGRGCWLTHTGRRRSRRRPRLGGVRLCDVRGMSDAAYDRLALLPERT